MAVFRPVSDSERKQQCPNTMWFKFKTCRFSRSLYSQNPHHPEFNATSGMEFFNDVGSDPLKPSLFELVAQEQLRDLLQPALKYVLAVSSPIPRSAQGSRASDLGIRSKIPAIPSTHRQSS